jgi:hypothetical protein
LIAVLTLSIEQSRRFCGRTFFADAIQLAGQMAGLDLRALARTLSQEDVKNSNFKCGASSAFKKQHQDDL